MNVMIIINYYTITIWENVGNHFYFEKKRQSMFCTSILELTQDII